jgi:hypothetical protein
MTMAKRDRKETMVAVVTMAAAVERVVTALETLVASQISSAATTISAATAWTLVNLHHCWPLVGRSILG